MKRILSVFLSLLLVLSFAGAAFANAPGDPDNDGAVTAADARIALRMAVGLEEAAPGSPEFLAAEVDGDGAVTAADARLILRAAVGLETLEAPEDPENPEDPEKPVGEKPTRREIYQRANAFTVEITSEIDEGVVLGSGFFVSEDGKLLTNYHVIENTKELTVKTADGKEYTEVTVLGIDRDVDIALLQIEGSFPCAQLNKTDYGTADTVYALGSSLGLTDTFSEGMISTGSRRLEDFSDVEYIQHTAAISQGNSGGPLMDEYGRVIGINTLGADEGQNLNFAVPVRYMDDLDLSHPMTVAEFTEAERNFKEIRLEGDFGDTALLRPGAVAAYPFSVRTRSDSSVAVKCESSALQVMLSESYYYYFLNIAAKAPCENVPVTLYLTDAPEISCTVTVTVSDAGGKNSGGMLEDVPDFGAMIGKAPTLEASSYSALPIYVYGGTFGSLGNADEIHAAYEEALTGAGFSLAQQQSALLGSVNSYVYTNAKLGLSLAYTETRGLNGRLRSVQIEIG